ncbi:Lysozyme-like domain protein [Venturia nashicola]|uniref:Lysozyme-like domain protein n=1 Tax=Venturia nashicola TaxID=86259 RepID=A0A4Z1NGQ2_9PEZI|nr:Lysozyme-like domain protein [Venturia nashicola]TLD20910.1 Lysozyme-like domain protein [Venturia nashicola]
MSLSFSVIWMTTIFGSVPSIPVSTSTSASLSTTAAVSSTIRSTTSTPSPRLAPRFYKTISTIFETDTEYLTLPTGQMLQRDPPDAAAVQPLSKRWERPKGPFTVTVPGGGAPVTVPNYPTPNTDPDDGAPVTVCTSDCFKHCSKHIFEPRQCLRFAKDIPSWGYLSSMKRGPFYESYTCLVCLNLPAMMETPNHPEGGNSLRETQDLVNAIYDVSVKANIPPQLAFAIAMQESQASVRPHSGDQGKSRGTFQVQIPGAITCLDTPIDGCTKDQIYAMVSLGICGQSSCTAPFQRPGIATYWLQYPTDIGRISRGYNSGSVYDQNDLTAVAFGTNSYSSDIANRMMGRVVGGFYSRTCCAKCDGRKILAVNTCGPVNGLKSDFCGDDRYSFHGQVG